jgi:RNase P subunit RPR2
MGNALSIFKHWMVAATVAEQVQLAELAGTTRGYLYQLANGYRSADASLAGRIEEASKVMHRRSKGRLSKVYRTDLCPSCRTCPYATKNKNKK